MVRTIDREERRTLLAHAVWQLMRRGGLEAASVRSVAAEAGLATGSVRHFFASQDELHIFALEELARRTTARVERALGEVADAADGDRAASSRKVLAGLVQLLPHDDETSADYLVHIQFVAKAMVHPPLLAAAARSQQALHDFYLQCLVYLEMRGLLLGRPDEETRRLAVLMDGLALQRLTAPDLLSTEEMIELLRAHLGALIAQPEPPIRPREKKEDR